MQKEFKQIRSHLQAAGLLPATCREVSPYYYAANTAARRRRAAGSVVAACRLLAAEAGIEAPRAYPQAAWCGRWPRTKASLEAEQRGCDQFWGLVASLQAAGVLPN